jgi:protein-disulfide isomerase
MTRMSLVGRRQLILGASAVALAACSGGNSGGGGAGTAPSPDDMVLGSPNARATLIEYASATCPHCAHFHETVWDQLKTHYIDTGKVRFIFREFPTPPEAVAVAGFQLARCGGATPEQYFARLGEIFRQQQAMFASGTMEGVRAKLLEIGASSGLTQDQVMQCISDESGAERIRRFEQGSQQFNVTGTPTLILNGNKIEDPRALTYEGLSQIIDAALAGHAQG